MNDYQLIVSILVVHFFAWLTPGPQITLIIRNSLIHSRKAALLTALGFAVGNFVHIAYSFLGIAFLIAKNPLLFNLIKFLGVSYLAYLGIKTFLTKSHLEIGSKKVTHHDISPFSAFRLGLLVNILNPYASVFFASIYSGAIATGASHWALVFLMLAMPLNTLLMASLWSISFRLEIIRNFYGKHQSIFNRCLGIALVLFALKIALSS